MPGTIGYIDAARANAVEIAKVETVLEKELGDRAARAGIDLGLEHIEVGLHGRAIGMLFRIGGDRHFDIGDALDAADKIGGVDVAARMRRVALADAAGRIAAQRHDVAHTRLRVGIDHCIDLRACGGDAGEVRRGRQHGLGEDALDG